MAIQAHVPAGQAVCDKSAGGKVVWRDKRGWTEGGAFNIIAGADGNPNAA